MDGFYVISRHDILDGHEVYIGRTSDDRAWCIDIDDATHYFDIQDACDDIKKLKIIGATIQFIEVIDDDDEDELEENNTAETVYLLSKVMHNKTFYINFDDNDDYMWTTNREAATIYQSLLEATKVSLKYNLKATIECLDINDHIDFDLIGISEMYIQDRQLIYDAIASYCFMCLEHSHPKYKDRDIYKEKAERLGELARQIQKNWDDINY